MNKTPHSNLKQIALEYLKRGWAPIPIPSGHKAPKIKNWPNLRISESQVEHRFSDPLNIGVLLGEPSGGLVDIDLDCEEASFFAKEFLPITRAVFGRNSRPKSHYLFQSDENSLPSQKFVDENGDCLLEIRTDGMQTIFPPSVHPSGEQVKWSKEGPPAKIQISTLEKAARLIAAAIILSRHYPEQGSRHELCLTVANLLSRAGYDQEEIERFLISLGEFVEDEEFRERGQAARYSHQRIADGGTAFGIPHLVELIGEPPTKKIAEILLMAFSKPGKTTIRDLVFRDLQPDIDLWKTEGGECFATVKVEGHEENHKIKSRPFRNWLKKESFKLRGKIISRATIDEIIDMMDARAFFGPTHKTWLRVAEFEGAIFIDLGDPDWSAVKITSAGWTIEENTPIKFIRGSGTLPLPRPKQNGNLEDLKPFVNLGTEENYILFFGSVIAALGPNGPYPVTVLNGEQGSAKTTLSRVWRAIVDPNKAPARSLPRNEDDLYVAASNSHALVFDNVSRISAAQADSICRISTGGGFSKRQLYTDLDEIIVDVSRPILINGIPTLVERPDLMDRAITLNLPRIRPSKRKTEKKFYQDFDMALPSILGGFYTALSAGLRARGKVALHEVPRMADMVEFVTAVENGLDWPPEKFLRAYEANRKAAMIDLAATDPLVEVILKIIDSGPFEGTASALLSKIRERSPNKDHPQAGIPRLPNRLAGHLKRIAPALREMGFGVDQDKQRDAKNRKIIKIWRLEEKPF